ncbi:MAG TPA: response regulator [Desulfuromonadales bacterium]|nr:response regulator [Desulfuromonadales bacterium]
MVEDDPSVRSSMERILAEYNHWQMVTVTSGESAIEAWKGIVFDLILLDIELPEMGGIEATRAIRKIEDETGRERTPIIAFSPRQYAEYWKECHEFGLDDFIPKPVKIESLVKAMKRFLPPADV